MPGAEGRKSHVAIKRTTMVIALLAFLQAGAQQKDKFRFGAYTGMSFGIGEGFGSYNSSHYSESYTPIIHLGGYTQYDIAERFALRLNAGYQGIIYSESFTGYGRDHSSSVLRGFFSFELNGIYNFNRKAKTQLYLSGGGGIILRNWDYSNYKYVNLNISAGMGVKIFLQNASQSAVTLGMTCHYLTRSLKFFYYDDDDIIYLKVSIGYEFGARRRPD